MDTRACYSQNMKKNTLNSLENKYLICRRKMECAVFYNRKQIFFIFLAVPMKRLILRRNQRNIIFFCSHSAFEFHNEKNKGKMRSKQMMAYTKIYNKCVFFPRCFVLRTSRHIEQNSHKNNIDTILIYI